MAPALTQTRVDIISQYIPTPPHTPSLRELHDPLHTPTDCLHSIMEHPPSGEIIIHTSKNTTITAPNSKNTRSNGRDYVHSSSPHHEVFDKCLDTVSSANITLSQPTPPHSTDSSAPLSPLPGDLKCNQYSKIHEVSSPETITEETNHSRPNISEHSNSVAISDEIANSGLPSPKSPYKDKLKTNRTNLVYEKNTEEVENLTHREDLSISNADRASPVITMGYCGPTSTNMLVNSNSAPQPNDTPPPSNSCKLSNILLDTTSDKMEEDSCKLTPPNSNVSSENATESNSVVSVRQSECNLQAPTQSKTIAPVKTTSIRLPSGTELNVDYIPLPDDVFSTIDTLLSKDIGLLNQVDLLPGSCSTSVASEPVAQLDDTRTSTSTKNSRLHSLDQTMNSSKYMNTSVDLAKDDLSARLCLAASRQLKLRKRNEDILRKVRRVAVRASYSEMQVQAKAIVEKSGIFVDLAQPMCDDDFLMSKLLPYVHDQEKLHDATSSTRQTARKSSLCLEDEVCEQTESFTSEINAVTRMYTAHDSDATDSSSAVESCDEADGYDDTMTARFKPIAARALPRLQRTRTFCASRWTWLEGRVQAVESSAARLGKRMRVLEQGKQAEEPPAPSPVDPASPTHTHRPYTCVTCPSAARTRPLRHRKRRRRYVPVGHLPPIVHTDSNSTSSCCKNVYSCSVSSSNDVREDPEPELDSSLCSCVAPFKCTLCTTLPNAFPPSRSEPGKHKPKRELLRTPEKVRHYLVTPERGSGVQVVCNTPVSSGQPLSLEGSPLKDRPSPGEESLKSPTLNNTTGRVPTREVVVSSAPALGTLYQGHRAQHADAAWLAKQRSFHPVLSHASEMGVTTRLANILSSASWMDRLQGLCCDDAKSEVSESFNASTCSSSSYTRSKKKKKDKKRKKKRDKDSKKDSLKMSIRKCVATGEMEVFDLNSKKSATSSADDASQTWDNSSCYSSRASTPAFDMRPSADRRPSTRSRTNTMNSGVELNLSIGAPGPVKVELAPSKEIETPRFYGTATVKPLTVAPHDDDDTSPLVTVARHRSALLDEQERFEAPQRHRVRRPNSTMSDHPMSPHLTDCASPMLSPAHTADQETEDRPEETVFHAPKPPFAARTFPLNREELEGIEREEDARKYQQLLSQTPTDVYIEHPGADDDAYYLPEDVGPSEDWAGNHKRKSLYELDATRPCKKGRNQAEDLRYKNGRRLSLAPHRHDVREDSSFGYHMKERRSKMASPLGSDTDSAGEDGVTGELAEHRLAPPVLTLTASTDSNGRCCYVSN